MGRSRTLPVLLLALAFGAAALFVWRRHQLEPLAVPRVESEAGNARAVASEPASTGAREATTRLPAQAPKALTGADPKRTAAITVVLIASGRPASAGEVELRMDTRKKGPAQSVDPLTGAARFADLGPGDYMVWVSKLPPGFLPPRAFQRNIESDYAMHRIRLDGEDRTLRVELEPAVRLFGYVRTPEGSLAKSNVQEWGSSIRIRCWRKSDLWAESVGQPYLEVVDGRYEADMYEGLWKLSVDGFPALDEAGSVEPCVAPAPVLRRLLPGSTTEVDFDFRAPGGALVRGRILDELGQPFADLRGGIGELSRLEDPTSGDTLQPGWPDGGAGGAFKTGPDGRFECANLVPGHYHLSVEPEGFSPRSGPGGRTKFGEVPPTREVDVSDGVNTIEITIRRAHPVHITGRIAVDEKWAAAHAQKGAQPTLEIVFGYGIEGVPDSRDSISYVNLDSSFEAWLDASMTNPRLELELVGEKLVLPLALAPDVTLEPLTIHFPR